MSFDGPDDFLLELDPEPTVLPTGRKLNRVQQAAQFLLANPKAFQASPRNSQCQDTSESEQQTTR